MLDVRQNRMLSMQTIDTKAPQTNPALTAVRAFQAGEFSLGQMAQVFEKSKAETMRLLAELGVPIADYDLAEDLETLEILERGT
jgi:hypothetical protein